MYTAYFERSLPLFAREDLIAVAAGIGIEASEIEKILDGDAFRDEVIADRTLATQLGATGVPFFVVDMKYGISGAQPLEAFTQTLEGAWAEAHA
jgi:predicted DsbA family dithiol-disulfide isomerase